MADLELSVMMTYVIICVTIVSFAVQWLNILPLHFYSPNLSFYLTLSFFFVFVYQLINMAMVGGMAIYENRLSVIISILVGLLLFVLLFAGRGLINLNFDRALALQAFHFDSMFNSNDQGIKFLTMDTFCLVFVVHFIIFTYSLVPLVLKYGNSYVGMSKETYRLEAELQREENQKRAAAAMGVPVPEEPQDDKGNDTASQLKESRRVVRWFNLALVFHLLAIFCWLKPLTDAWNSHLKDGGLGIEVMRLSFIVLHIGCLLKTYKTEIGRYMLRVYDTITTLLNDPSQENLRAVRSRTEAHIGYMGVMSYQVVMKIIIPVLLVLLFVDKRMAIHLQTKDQIKTYYDMNNVAYLDWNCYGIRDPMEIFQQATMCPTDKNFEVVAIENGLGLLNPGQPTGEGLYGVAKDVLRKIQKYGFVHNEFAYTVISLWLFLYYLVTYLLTILYIFYRKAIEQV